VPSAVRPVASDMGRVYHREVDGVEHSFDKLRE
jgi:hypothetical protein